MSITVELPADVEERFAENARIRGLSPSEYAGQLIADSVPQPDMSWRTRHISPEDFERAMDELAKIMPRGLPPLSDEALRRENMYEREDDML